MDFSLFIIFIVLNLFLVSFPTTNLLVLIFFINFLVCNLILVSFFTYSVFFLF